MIRALICLSLVISLCHAQTSSDPVAPEITLVDNRETGIYVEWKIETTYPIFSQRVSYTDSLGRSREQSARAEQRLTYLYFVQPCMHYKIKVITTFFKGEKLESKVHELTRSKIPIPPAPINLAISDHAEGYTLRWELPQTNAPISKLNIIGREDGGEIVHQSVAYDQTEAKLSSFHFHHNYNVTMTSENTCGASEESKPVRLLELHAPGEPKIVSTIPLQKSIRVTFEKNVDDLRVDKFHLNYTTPTGVISVPPMSGSTTTVTLTEGIESCVKYQINLWAENAIGQSNAATTSAYAFSTDIAPTPTNLLVSEVDGNIQLTWDSQSTDKVVTNQIVYQSAGGKTTTELVDGGVTKATLEHVKRCETYTLRMRAESKCGYSAWTSWTDFKVKPQERPSRIMDFTASGKADLVELTWKAANTDEYLEQYDLLVVDLAASALTYWVPPNAEKFSLRKLTSGGSYAISIRAANACGWSEPLDLFIEITAEGVVRPLALNSRTVSLLKRARRAALAQMHP